MLVSFVDRIVSIHPGHEIAAVKNLSFREDYLREHFPGYPLMPGALQLEAMIQSAQWLLRATLDFPAADFPAVVVSNTRYARYVRPGDQLDLKVSLVGKGTNRFKFRGVGSLEGQRTIQAQFELARYEDSWTLLDAPARRSLIDQQRATFRRLSWAPTAFAPVVDAVLAVASPGVS